MLAPVQLLDAHRCADLARLYSLAGRVGAHDALRTAWRDHIKATGTKLVRDEEKVRLLLPGIACERWDWGQAWLLLQGGAGS